VKRDISCFNTRSEPRDTHLQTSQGSWSRVETREGDQPDHEGSHSLLSTMRLIGDSREQGKGEERVKCLGANELYTRETCYRCLNELPGTMGATWMHGKASYCLMVFSWRGDSDSSSSFPPLTSRSPWATFSPWTRRPSHGRSHGGQHLNPKQ
jgi:hypothetical protein